MIARPPCRSKNSWVRSMYDFLKRRESSRAKIRGPTPRPIQYPICGPMNAASTHDQRDEPDGQVYLLSSGEQPNREQQRVAGQDREEQPRLDDDDRRHREHGGRTELVDEVVEERAGVEPVWAEGMEGGKVNHGASLRW